MAMVTSFKKKWAAVTASLYVLLKGLFIGGISAVLEASYLGIVIQATGLTFGTLFVYFHTKNGLNPRPIVMNEQSVM